MQDSVKVRVICNAWHRLSFAQRRPQSMQITSFYSLAQRTRSSPVNPTLLTPPPGNSLPRIRVATPSAAISSRPLWRQFPSPPPPQAAPAQKTSGWTPTSRITATGRLDLFRARAASQLGPGCYLLKRPRLPGDEIARQQLVREALVSREVAHPNLTCVLASAGDDQRPVNILPYFEGISLADILRTRPHATIRASNLLAIGRQIAAALASLHQGQWLHGRLELAHVIVSPQRHITLINVSAARRLTSAECQSPNWPPSSWLYLAPETFSATLQATPAVDLYALGVLLYTLVARQPPFVATSVASFRRAHLHQRPPELNLIPGSVSHAVNDLIYRLLAKDPFRRPTADEVVRWCAELEIQALT